MYSHVAAPAFPCLALLCFSCPVLCFAQATELIGASGFAQVFYSLPFPSPDFNSFPFPSIALYLYVTRSATTTTVTGTNLQNNSPQLLIVLYCKQKWNLSLLPSYLFLVLGQTWGNKTSHSGYGAKDQCGDLKSRR